MPINRLNPFITRVFDTTPDPDVIQQVLKATPTSFTVQKYRWFRQEQCFYRQKYR
jgi:hypothetical protein